MKPKNKNEGSITIFLSIIFLSFIIMVGVIADAAGIHTAQVHAQRALDIAVRSVLSEYDKNLKYEYGLFGVKGREEEIEQKILAYTNRMLKPSLNVSFEENISNLYDFQIEDIDVEIEDLSLNNATISKKQLMEYMRYRAPLSPLYDFSKSTNYIRNASNGLEIIDKATVVFKELATMDAVINELRQYTDGWYYENSKAFNTYTFFVKSLSVCNGEEGLENYEKNLYSLLQENNKKALYDMLYSKKELENLFKQYYDEWDQYIYYKCGIIALDEAYKRMKLYRIHTTDEEEKAYYDKIVKRIRRTKKNFTKKMKNIDIEQHIVFYQQRRNACSHALQSIRQIILLGQNTKELIEDFEKLLNQYDNAELTSLTSSLKQDVAMIKGFLGEGFDGSLLHAESSIKYNRSLLDNWMESFIKESHIQHMEKEAKALGSEISFHDFSIDDLMSTINELVNKDPLYFEKKRICRKAFNLFLSKYDSDFSIEPFSANQIIEMLGESIKRDNSKKDFQFDRTMVEEDDGLKEKDRQLKNEYVIQQLPSNIILEQDMDNNFLDKDNKLNLLDGFKIDKLKNIMDTLYMNEYILSLFRHHMCKDWEKECFFNHEIEYILYGNLSDQVNFNKCKRDLFLVRSGLNLMHIYSDSAKRMQTFEIASAMSGGIGVFFTQFLIASAWAGAESDKDLDFIFDGEKVAFIKTRKSWFISYDQFFSGSSDKNHKPVSDDELSFNMFDYSDYLRLFLLMRNEDTRLYRTLDIIQINMKGRYYSDFETRNYLGACHVNANFSMKHMFLDLYWMPEYIKNSTLGRKIIKVQTQHSY